MGGATGTGGNESLSNSFEQALANADTQKDEFAPLPDRIREAIDQANSGQVVPRPESSRRTNIDEILARAPNEEDGTVLVNSTTGEVLRTRAEADADLAASVARGRAEREAGIEPKTLDEILNERLEQSDKKPLDIHWPHGH